MKKLNLRLEDLAVESFETTAEGAARRGTVHGAQVSQTTCAQIICDCQTNGAECDTADCGTETEARTCGASCTFFCSHSCPVNTCAYTCGNSCGCPTQGAHETCGIC